MTTIRFSLALTVSLAVNIAAAEGSTWYVDDDNFGATDKVLDGRTESSAWGTLQDAHDKAAAGDTVIVLPGVYSEGESVDMQGHKNRLMVSKKLYFKAKEGSANTHIVGQIDLDTKKFGPKGVRGILVADGGLGSEFHGFTIRGCASGNGGDSSNGKTTGMGGGVLVYGDYTDISKQAVKYQAYFVDCVFSNNFAKWGGAMRGGTAIRCLIADNSGQSFGQAVCAGALWNSVVRGTKALDLNRPTIGHGVIAVNSTFYGNGASGVCGKSIMLYNCAFNMQDGSVYRTTDSSNVNFFNTYQNTYEELSERYVMMSPATGDYRPIKGLALEGSGLSEYMTSILALPPDTEMKDFNGNPLDLNSTVCDAGAVQGAVAPDGGCMVLSADTFVNGVYNRSATYAYVEKWPTQLKVEAVDSALMYWLCRNGSSSGGILSHYYPQYDGATYLMPQATAGSVASFSAVTAKSIIWTDPDAAAAGADGTESKPFRTLQAAMDHIADNSLANTIVYAKPGDYDEGEAFAFGHTNRVVFPSAQSVLLKSVGGAKVTTIRGRMDNKTAPYPGQYRGCGPNAIRCVTYKTAPSGTLVYHAIQGFTLADGCGNATNNSYKVTEEGDQGGGIRGYSDFYVLDSVFTNCNAVRSGAIVYGKAFRCVFDDCVSWGGVTRDCVLTSCEVLPTCSLGSAPSGASKNSVCGSSTKGVFSTLPVSIHIPFGTTIGRYYGCLFNNDYANQTRYWGSVFDDSCAVGLDTGAGKAADVLFVDAAAQDYRLRFDTPVRSSVRLPDRDTEFWSDYSNYLFYYSSGDINGNPLSVIDGVALPGARHSLVKGVVAHDDTGVLEFSGAASAAGFTESEDGADLVVSQKAGVMRPTCGVAVNGAVRYFDPETGSLEIDGGEIASSGVTVEPVFSRDWYVDKSKGDDSNLGYAPDCPRKTLPAILAAAVDGDTVHVGPGTYDSGLMHNDGSEIQASRAVLPAGVTMISAAGPDQTAIVGSPALVGVKDNYNRGTNAVRCVFMYPGSKLKGFTLRDGVVNGLGSNGFVDPYVGLPDWCGGGVFSPNYMNADDVARTVVENCVVSNCAALVGGAGRGVTFSGCRIMECKGVRGAAIENCGAVNTVIDNIESDGSSGISACDVYSFVNVTLGDNIRNSTSSSIVHAYFKRWNRDYGATNCLIIGAAHNLTQAVNCVFVKSLPTDPGIINCKKASLEELMLDENYRPSVNSILLVDAGLESPWDKIDASGGQRIYNGAIDIGAMEADWRARYAATLGARGLEVVSADPQVVDAGDGRIRMSEGSIVMNWANRQSPKPVKMTGTVEVEDAGVLGLSVNGVTRGQYDADDGATGFIVECGDEAPEFKFTYTPPEAGPGVAYLSSFRRLAGTVLIVR